MHHRRTPPHILCDGCEERHSLYQRTLDYHDFQLIFIISDFPNCSFSICNQFEILTLKFINFNIFRVFRFNIHHWHEYSLPYDMQLTQFHSSFFFTIIFAVLLNTMRVHSRCNCHAVIPFTSFSVKETLFILLVL